MMKGTRVTMTMGSHPGSQGLYTCTPHSQQRPALTQLTSPQPSAQSYPSPPDVLEACHSKKGSAGAKPSTKKTPSTPETD